MNEELQINSENQAKTWLERLAQALLGEPQDREQLITLLRDSEQRNLFDSDALGMIEGVLQVSEMQARDIMVPRSQMVVLERDSDIKDILPTVVESNHSRFPVIGENLDEVIGILLAKDLLQYFVSDNKSKFYLRDIIRQAIVIPESKRLNILLNEFRSSRNHMAIVVDEYGGVSGLVTIEDVLEQIVGEIEDEHDIDEDAYIKDHGDQNYTIKALTPIEDFNEHFLCDFTSDEYDTLGGLLLNRIGHLPTRGELIEIDGFHFKILRADNRRIHLLYMTVISEPQAGASVS
ncbi:MAG: HlyC/CorC family transporter [Thiohalomonadales bacterium]